MKIGDIVTVREGKKLKEGKITEIYPEGKFGIHTMYEVRTSPIHTGLFKESELKLEKTS